MKSITFKNVVLWDEFDAIPPETNNRRYFVVDEATDFPPKRRTIPAIAGPSDYQHQVMKAIEHYLGNFASMPCIACGRMVKARFETLDVVTYETCCN